MKLASAFVCEFLCVRGSVGNPIDLEMDGLKETFKVALDPLIRERRNEKPNGLLLIETDNREISRWFNTNSDPSEIYKELIRHYKQLAINENIRVGHTRRLGNVAADLASRIGLKWGIVGKCVTLLEIPVEKEFKELRTILEDDEMEKARYQMTGREKKKNKQQH